MEFTAPPQRDKLIWYGVDFDGTIAESNWSPDNPNALPGAPIEHTRLQCERAVSKGRKIIVHTSRPWADYELIEAWLQHHNYPYKAIVCGKLLVDAYIDDRNRDMHSEWA